VDAERPPTPTKPRTSGDFDALYAGAPPWDIGRPQPAFLELAKAGELHGRVLDLGCGTGEHVLMAAARGLDATGVDSSAAAITIAQSKAQDRGIAARLLVADALELASLHEQFDTLLDSGLFHIFNDDDRARYVHSLATATKPDARYHMLCFSDREPGDWGPRRITRTDIESAFTNGWRIDSIEPTTFTITIDPGAAHAWQVSITRTSGPDNP